MAVRVALLRGINVGGRNRLPMAALRDSLTEAGWGPVQTYIQSGNVVLESSLSNTQLAEQIAARLLEQFDIQSPVAVLKRNELKQLLQEHPFADCPIAERHVTLLPKALNARQKKSLAPSDSEPDDYWIQGRVIYVRCRHGYAKAAWSNAYFERRLKMPATSRNWKTMLRLGEMVE